MKLCHALRVWPGDVVSLTGGGGKTTTMFRLAGELVEQNFRVLTTTTTRIFTGQIEQASVYLTFDPDRQSLADILPRLAATMADHGQVLLVRPIEPGATKAVGLPPETVDALAAAGQVDAIIVEADGARSHPFKAPAPYEPVIPASTSRVVPLLGLEVLGQPLNGETVHRPEQVSRLSGVPLGQPVTMEAITKVWCHPQGGLKNLPPHARFIPLLNKAETPERLAAARQLSAYLLRCPPVDSVMIGSVQDAARPVLETHTRSAAIVLAAGGSTRFGSPKPLARWRDQTFIERVVDVALTSQVDMVIVVLGAAAEPCRAALRGRPVQVVVNEDWMEGQSTSVKAGLSALPENVGSAVFLLVDQPGVTPAVVNALLQRYRQTLAPAVRPQFQEQAGNPVLFDRALFADLNRLSGDVGGRAVLKNQPVERVPVDTAAVLQDFDRPGDLAQIESS